MAYLSVKISELSESSIIASSDILPIVTVDGTRKITFANFTKDIVSGTISADTINSNSFITMASAAGPGSAILKLQAGDFANPIIQTYTTEDPASFFPLMIQSEGGNVCLMNSLFYGWKIDRKTLQISDTTGIIINTDGTHFVKNSYLADSDELWKYMTNNYALDYVQDHNEGIHKFLVGTIGDPDTDVTWSTIIQTNAAGQVAIGNNISATTIENQLVLPNAQWIAWRTAQDDGEQVSIRANSNDDLEIYTGITSVKIDTMTGKVNAYGMVETSKLLRAISWETPTLPSSGIGIEVYYDSSTQSIINSIDRATPSYKNLTLNSHHLFINAIEDSPADDRGNIYFGVNGISDDYYKQWNYSTSAIQFGNGNGITYDSGYFSITTNAYFDGANWKNIDATHGGSTQYYTSWGNHYFGVAPIQAEIGTAFSFTNALSILNNGNIGIGTETVPAKLTIKAINSVISGDGNLFIYSSDSMAANLGGSIMLGASYTGTSPTTMACISGRKENGNDADIKGYLQFCTSNNITGMVERMRIDSIGNVGIATDSPVISDGTGLHINGSIIRIANSKSPASNGTGNVGEICWDSSYIYVCTASNTWERAAITGGY